MLKQEEMVLLHEIVARRNAGLTPVVASIGGTPLTKEIREALRGVLADELVEFGLLSDDEPNAYGLRVDGLIGRLRHV